MAPPAKGKVEVKTAAKKEKKPKTKKAALYTEGKSNNKSCPKCGPGVFMAAHKDRKTCGNCGFTEWN